VINDGWGYIMTLLSRVIDRLWGYRTSRTFADTQANTITLLHDSGFFSNCSALLLELARSAKHPLNIDASRSFSHFTEPDHPFEWAHYFQPAPESTAGNPERWRRSRLAMRLPHHSLYRFLDFRISNEILADYFVPSDKVRLRMESITREKLPTSLDNVAVLCVRGTDKGTEVRQSSTNRYLKKAQRIIRRHKNVTVWVQTDQAQLQTYFLEKLGPRAFSPDVLPITAGTTVMHRSETIEDRGEFALNLLATTWLMSQASRVITYSGNVGYWIALFRGSARGLHQLR
jgi:hypothetical protein